MSLAVFEPGRRLIEKLFSDGWAAQTPIKFENVKFHQPANAPWVALYVRWAFGEQVSVGPVGRRLERHGGAVVVQVFTPKSGGQKLMMDYCDAAASVLRMQTLIDAPTGIELELRAPDLIDAGEEKLLLHKNVSVPFRIDALF